MFRWLLGCFASVFLCAVDFNAPELVTDQDFFLSFWRSGTNWLFTCIQAITHKPVRYIVKDHEDAFCSNPCTNHLRIPLNISKKPLYHTHSCAFVKQFLTHSNRLLLIVRSYKETILRHVEDDAAAFASAIDEEVFFDYYFEYLSIFDQWDPSARLLVYYEDLILFPRKTLTTVLSFLDEDSVELDGFMQNFDRHRIKTLNSYHAQYLETQGSMSRGKDVLFHSKKVPHDLLLKADQLVMRKYPVLWSRYLRRYE